MEKIHNTLRSKFEWYDRWHTNAHSSAVNWSVFLLIAILATLVVLKDVNQLFTLVDTDAQLGVAAASRTGGRALAENAKLARIRVLTNQALEHTGRVGGPAIAELKELLTERRTAISELAKTDPKAVKGLLFNDDAVNTFPEEVRGLLEKPTKKAGTYRIAIVTTAMPGDEHEHGEEALTEHEEGYEEYILETDDGERYQLYLTPDEAYAVAPETIVTVTGADIGDDVIIPTSDMEVGDWDGEPDVLGASTIKKIAIVAFNFSSNPLQPLTTAQIKERVFTGANSVNAYYKEISYGQWEIQGRDSAEGDVYDWVTIPATADGSCNYSGWATMARDELTKKGVNLTGYTNIQYVFPGDGAGCGWSGLAYLGGSTSWVKAASVGAYVSGHELGHNFGFHHAASYGCTVATNVSPSTCTSSEYGDLYDIMGKSAKHTNNYNKAKYWLGPSQMQTVTSGGTYQIEPLELTTGGVKLLRIKRPFTSSLGTFTDGYYQIEQRARVGTFGNYTTTDTVTQGIIVRLVGDYAYSGRKTFFVRKILPGESMVDSEAGITISLEGVSSTSANVAINKAAPACVRYAPTVTVSPVSAWVSAGTLASYTIKVKNNDGEGCAPTTFTVTSALPADLTQTPQTLSLTANPLSEVSGTISLLSPLTSVPGTYPVTVTATHGDAGTAAQATLNYNVIAPDTIAPAVSVTSPTDGATLAGGGKQNIAITATASDATGVAAIDVLVDGKVMKTCSAATTCSYTWSYRKAAAGAHTVEATATDTSTSANKSTARVTVTK